MVHMMLYTPVRSLTLVEQQEVWNGRQRKIKNLMCQIDKKKKPFLLLQILKIGKQDMRMLRTCH